MADTNPIKLRVGAYEGKPFGWFDAQGNPRGLIYEGVKKALEKLGENHFEIELILSSNERINQELMAGRIDVVFAFLNQELSEQSILLSDAIPSYILLISNIDKPLLSIDDAPDFSIATTPPYKNAAPENKRKVISRTTHLLHLITSGRVDAAITSFKTLRYQSEVEGLSLEDFERVELVQMSAHLLCSKRSEIIEYCKQWQNSLREVVDENFMEDVFQEIIKEHTQASR